MMKVQKDPVGATAAVSILMPTPSLVPGKDYMPYGLGDSSGIAFTILGTGNADALCGSLCFPYRVFFL